MDQIVGSDGDFSTVCMQIRLGLSQPQVIMKNRTTQSGRWVGGWGMEREIARIEIRGIKSPLEITKKTKKIFS